MTVSRPIIERLVIIGMGLIGGSLARALRVGGAVGEIIGVGRNCDALAKAVDWGVIDSYCQDSERAVAGADLVVIATPVGTMEEIFQRISGALNPVTTITDVGSVKAAIVTAAQAALGPHFPRFVPGHPIAGTERSGVAASEPDLFRDRHVILTPVVETAVDAVALVREMWECSGARVTEMTATLHDRVLGATSHLPHILAYTLVDFLAGREDNELLFKFAAGGFYDFTRIASSDPTMWRDICVSNKAVIAAALSAYRDTLDRALDALQRGDGEQLEALFANAKAARDRHSKHFRR